MDILQIILYFFVASIALRVLLFVLKIAPTVLGTLWDVICIAASAVVAVFILAGKGLRCISQALAKSAPVSAYKEYRYKKAFNRVAARYFDK